MVSITLALALPLLFGAEPVSGSAATTHRLVLVEQFVANGAEETYWLSSTEAKLERGPGATHEVEFGFDFERFETKIGGERPAALAVQSGHNRLVIGEDPATQQLDMVAELPVVNFLNGVLGRMNADLDRSEEWSEPVRVFDGSVLPGFDAGEVTARFQSTVVPAGRSVLRMLQFETDPVAFRTNGSNVEVSFRGAALVDEDKSLSYHTLFEQSGVVTGRDGATTTVRHTATMFLEDLGGEPVVPVDVVDDFASVHGTYTFLGEPELQQLYPDLVDAKPNPAWMITTWLAGRLANGALGGVAENSVNPVPTMALGSVVLTDQSIAYAGNLLLDRKAFEEGRITEEEIDINDGQYRSPLQYALAPEGGEPVPMDQRLALLGPEFVGAARIGGADDAAAIIIGFGMLKGAAGVLLGSSSRLAPILSSSSAVPYAGVVATTGGASTGIATSTLLLGAGGAAGVGVAVSSSGGSSEGSGPPQPGNTSGLPCNTAVVSGGEGVTSTLHELGSDPGSVTILFEPGDNIGDELEVFYDGSVVTDTGGPVTGSQALIFNYVPEDNVTEIVVVVTGGVASFWNYSVGCPQ